MLIAALSLLVVAFASVSLWLWQRRRLRLKSWLASAALVAWVVGVGVKVYRDRSAEAAPTTVASLPSIAWPTASAGAQPGGAVLPPLPSAASTAADSSPTQVAPVDSLIGGLERRLADQPNDAAGWALLAQSYAFMGDAAAADGAVQKAIALGADETALRARVEGAMRTAHPR